MYESIFSQMYVLLCKTSINNFYLILFTFTSSIMRNFCMDSNIPFIHCSKDKMYFMFKLTLMPKVPPPCRNDANGIKPGSNSKMTG